MTEIKNILISNVYSWKNKGDAAIVIAMLDDVKKQFPEAKITLSTHDPEDFGKYGKEYDYTLNFEPLLYTRKESKISRLLKSKAFLSKIKVLQVTKCNANKLFSKKIAEKINSYKNYDLVIACGGGYLLTTTHRAIISRLIFAQDFYMAKHFNVPYILYNQSIGPFHAKYHYLLLKKILNSANAVLIREEISFKRMQDYGMKNIHQVADIAFTMGVEENKELVKKYLINEKKENIGLTVRKWLSEEKQRKYEDAIQNFIEDYLKENPQTTFYFMPQVIYKNHGDDDLVTSRKIFERLGEKEKKQVKIIDEDINPKVLKYIISKMNFFIGTRMHSNIFALSSIVKTLAIAYEPKTRGIMKMLKLEDYVMEMEDVTTDLLNTKFQLLKADSEYTKILEKNVEVVKSKNLPLKMFL